VLAVPERVALRGRTLSPFRLTGLAGLAAAVAVALGMSAARGLSIPVELGLIATAIAVFIGLALATKALTGRETLIYYHHEIAVLAAVAAMAAVLGAPVLAHLDVTCAGLGAFLALGRLGCLMAGCCHGRPARRGVLYGQAHADQGFPEYLVGVPVVPVQAIEAAAATVLVVVCAAIVSMTPGVAFGTYVTGYAVIRFGLELLRGDPVRRYWHGVSEAQWTSLLVAGAMAALAAIGLIPGLAEHAAASAALVLAALLVANRPSSAVLHPRHVRELAAGFPAPRAGRPVLTETSQGVRLSAGAVAGVTYYTITRPRRPLEDSEAAELARVISWLSGVRGPDQVVAGAAGAYHLLVGAPARPHLSPR
jgi:Prolipoprotein diacylglyceryl transferase